MSHLQRLTGNRMGIVKYIASVSSLGYVNNYRKLNEILCEFLKSKNIESKKWNKKYKGLFTADLYNCGLIQSADNWKDFKIFIRTNYPNEQVKQKLPPQD